MLYGMRCSFHYLIYLMLLKTVCTLLKKLSIFLSYPIVLSLGATSPLCKEYISVEREGQNTTFHIYLHIYINLLAWLPPHAHWSAWVLLITGVHLTRPLPDNWPHIYNSSFSLLLWFIFFLHFISICIYILFYFTFMFLFFNLPVSTPRMSVTCACLYCTQP
jgi:hypothetical protein